MYVPSFIIEISIVIFFTLHIRKNIAYHVTEVLIFYADKLMVTGNSKICVSLISQFYYSNCENLMLVKYTCLTVSPMNCITCISSDVICGRRLTVDPRKVAYCRGHRSSLKIRGMTQTQNFSINTSLSQKSEVRLGSNIGT